ncbi:MAG: 2-hydroxyacyl-CoA dehydratase [Deltaproteobacteria bacterium]|nr:2-hydroxyacyl-CoA dehydratase [Deltaproteobacteria bacterium]
MGNEKKKKTRKSGKTLETAREAGYFAKKMLTSALKATEEGRPTGWSMVTWWQGELIAKAMGVELVFPENYGAFCAAVRKAEPHLEVAESEGFPATLCGYARNCIGYTKMLADNDFVPLADAPGGGLAKPVFLLSSGCACDARYKWFQALGRYLDNTPVWTLDIPQTGANEFFLKGNKEAGLKFMVLHLKEYVSFLENLLKKKLDYDKLSEMVDMTYKTLRLAYEVDVLRRAVPSPMVGTDFWSIMIPHLYLPDDPEAYEFYQRVYAEVKNKVDNKIGAIPNEKYRMMFSELPPWHSLGFFDELAERFGIAIVIESWNYHANLPIPEEEIQGVTDPIELIARLSYQKWTEYNGVARKYEVEPGFFMAAYFQYAEDYKVDGLFAHPLMSCRPATYTLLHTRNMLEEKIKIPGVVIDGDIIDLRVFNEEEAFSKVEAFVETMDHYRDLRKEAGMAW